MYTFATVLASMSLPAVLIVGDALNMSAIHGELPTIIRRAGPSPMAIHIMPLDRRWHGHERITDERTKVIPITSQWQSHL